MIKNRYLKFTVVAIVVLLMLVRVLFHLISEKDMESVIKEVEANKAATTTEVTSSTTVTTSDKTSDTTNKTNTNKKTMTQTTASGLVIEDEKVGTGDTAVAGKDVTVQYVGQLMNGTIFDASKNHGDTGFTFSLGAGQVIKGWDEGVAGMKVGGKRKLTIPSALAYGNQAVGGVIPANSDLIFEVELLKVSK